MTSSEPRNPTDFDHFVRFVVACLAFAFLCIALGACNTAAKQCRKAEKHMADAIHLCPSIMLPQVKTDTITIYTKPTAIAAGRSYSQASMDSLAMICAELIREARNVPAEVVYERSPRQRLTKALCAFAPLDTTDGPCGIRVWEDAGRIRLFHHKSSERVDTVYKFVYRDVQAKPCPPVSRVRSWPWLAFLLGCGAVGALWFWSAFMRVSHRHDANS